TTDRDINQTFNIKSQNHARLPCVEYHSRGRTSWKRVGGPSFRRTLRFQLPGIYRLDHLKSFQGYIRHHRHRTKLLAHVLNHKQENTNTDDSQNDDHGHHQLPEISFSPAGDDRHAVDEGEDEQAQG